MGQSINVESQPVDGFCVFTTDRVLTGQDGSRYESATEAESGDGFPAKLASDLFNDDEHIENVYVASSEVIVGRDNGWDTPAVAAATTVIKDLYRFYEAG